MIHTAGLVEVDVEELFSFAPADEAKAAHAEVVNLWRQAISSRAVEDYLSASRACEAAAAASASAGNAEHQVRALISAGGCLMHVIAHGHAELLDKATEHHQRAASLAKEAALSELEAMATGYVVSCMAASLVVLEKSTESAELKVMFRELDSSCAASQEQLIALGKTEMAAGVQVSFAHGLVQLASMRGSTAFRERAQAEAEKALTACREAGFAEARLGFAHVVLGTAMRAVARDRQDPDLLKRAGDELAAGAVRVRMIPGEELSAAVASWEVATVSAERADWTGEPKGWRGAGRWFQDAAERLGKLGRTAEQEQVLAADREALAKWVAATSPEFDKPGETVLRTKGDNEGEGRIADDPAVVATDVDAGADFAAAVAHAREAVHVVASRLQERLDQARRFMPTEVADREELVRQVDEALALGVELRVGGERSTKLMLQRGSALTWRIGSSGAAGFRKNAVEVSVPGLQEPEVAIQQPDMS